MLLLRKFSSTSNTIRASLRNSTTGGGLTGLTSASSGLIISTIADNEATATAYTVAGSTIESITTLGTFATPTATKCRFKEVDATNHPGLYEIQLADARFAVASSKVLFVTISGATNLISKDIVIQLTTVDPDSAAFGLSIAKTTNITGFNDIAATAIVSAGAITTSSGAVSSVTTVGSVTGAVGSVTGNIGGNLLGGVSGNVAGSVGSVVGSVGSVTGSVGSVTGNVGGNVNGNVVGSVASVTAAVTVGTINTDAISAAAVSAAAVTKIQAGLSTLDAAGIRTAIGMASADLDTQLDAILSATNSWGNTIWSTIDALQIPTAAQNAFAVWSSVQSSYVTSGTFGYLLDARISTISGGGGSGLDGPSSVTLTFEDSNSDPVPLVDVTVVGQGVIRSNVSGVAAFGLDDGTYTVVARAAGLLFANTTLVVSGTTTQTITGTAVTISPASDPAQTNAYCYTRDAHGALQAAVTITFKLKVAPGDDSFPTDAFTATSDSNGLLQVTLNKSSDYIASRSGTGATRKWTSFTTGTGSTYALPQITGPYVPA